jgi:hypothetical protein
LTRCFRCHAGFQVDGCRVHDIATDGIVLYYCQDGVIERCTAWRTGIGKWHRTPVGIWYFMAAHCVIQFCESFDNHPAGGHADGGGFDLDGGCVDCTLQYNYSHDNAGAGYLVCSYDPKTAPCLRCTVRFNLSVNDGRMNDFAAIQFWQADDCRVYNNTCVTRVGHGLKFASETKGNLFANNLFLVGSGADTACVKSPFAIAANRFRNNLYWRLDGKPRFEVLDRLRLSWREFQALAGTRGERCAAPRLTAQSGPDIRLQKDSPALGAGVRLPDMGDRDLYNAPVRKSGPVAIGAAQGMSR